MCAARTRPERPERLVRQDAACASGRTFFFLMVSLLSSHTPLRGLVVLIGVVVVAPVHG